MSALDESLFAVLEGYKAAVLAKDVDAFAALYDTEVRVFDLWGEGSCNGVAAWRAMAVGWFESLGTETVVVGATDVTTQMTGQLAAVQAFLTYTAVSAVGEVLRSMSNRLTWILERRGEAWKIVHEHTSAPIDASTMKGILQR